MSLSAMSRKSNGNVVRGWASGVPTPKKVTLPCGNGHSTQGEINASTEIPGHLGCESDNINLAVSLRASIFPIKR